MNRGIPKSGGIGGRKACRSGIPALDFGLFFKLLTKCTGSGVLWRVLLVISTPFKSCMFGMFHGRPPRHGLERNAYYCVQRHAFGLMAENFRLAASRKSATMGPCPPECRVRRSGEVLEHPTAPNQTTLLEERGMAIHDDTPPTGFSQASPNLGGDGMIAAGD